QHVQPRVLVPARGHAPRGDGVVVARADMGPNASHRGGRCADLSDAASERHLSVRDAVVAPARAVGTPAAGAGDRRARRGLHLAAAGRLQTGDRPLARQRLRRARTLRLSRAACRRGAVRRSEGSLLLVAGPAVRGRRLLRRSPAPAAAPARRRDRLRGRHVSHRQLERLAVRRQLWPPWLHRCVADRGGGHRRGLPLGGAASSGGDADRGRAGRARPAVVRADGAVLAGDSAGRRYHLGSVPRAVPAVPMTRRRTILLVAVGTLAGAAWYLHDPPWIAG